MRPNRTQRCASCDTRVFSEDMNKLVADGDSMLVLCEECTQQNLTEFTGGFSRRSSKASTRGGSNGDSRRRPMCKRSLCAYKSLLHWCVDRYEEQTRHKTAWEPTDLEVTLSTVPEELSRLQIGADRSIGERSELNLINPESHRKLKFDSGQNGARGNVDAGTMRRLNNGPLDRLFASAQIAVREKLQGGVEGKVWSRRKGLTVHKLPSGQKGHGAELNRTETEKRNGESVMKSRS